MHLHNGDAADARQLAARWIDATHPADPDHARHWRSADRVAVAHLFLDAAHRHTEAQRDDAARSALDALRELFDDELNTIDPTLADRLAAVTRRLNGDAASNADSNAESAATQPAEASRDGTRTTGQ